MINARAESILDKPAFAKPFGVRRCLVPADGYYEWRVLPDGASPAGSAGAPARRGKVPKQPYWSAPGDGRSAAFAGLYEFWRDRTKADDDPDRWLVSTTIITTDAAPYLAEIHDRMPLALPSDAWDAWLDPAVDARGAADLLGLGGPHDDVPMVAREISTLVNSVTNDGPGLLEAVCPARGLPRGRRRPRARRLRAAAGGARAAAFSSAQRASRVRSVGAGSTARSSERARATSSTSWSTAAPRRS